MGCCEVPTRHRTCPRAREGARGWRSSPCDAERGFPRPGAPCSWEASSPAGMPGRKINPAGLQHPLPRHGHRSSASLRAQLRAVGVFLYGHFAGKQQNATAPSLLSPPAPRPDIPWAKNLCCRAQEGWQRAREPLSFSYYLLGCVTVPHRSLRSLPPVLHVLPHRPGGGK